jgi:hypothetical protein
VSLAGVAPVAVLALAGDPGLQGFQEAAVERGIDYVVPAASGAGRGVAFVDLDGDGDADAVAVGAADGAVGLWENDGTGHFTDRSATAGVPPLVAGSSGVTAADYDNDGDLDLYFANWQVPNVLVRNEGDWTFTDVTAQAGVGNPGASTGCCWGDYDGDGWLDLYVANITNTINTVPNELYRNLGDGTFEPVGADLGVDDSSMTWQSVFFDYDLDGDPDLYTSNDKGFDCHFHNHLFENLGGTFQDVTASSGTAACMFSMGVGIGDLDGNLLLDLYCTNMPLGNKLFLNQGSGVFLESAKETGTASYEIGWGATFFDLDNDTRQDLYVCNQGAPNRMYYSSPASSPLCPNMAQEMLVDVAGDSYCVATADVDVDGDVDLLVQTANEPLRLFLNRDGSQRNWSRLNVVGPAPNRFAVGATVKIRVGAQWQIRHVVAGGNNFKSQNELTTQFGLDAATVVDEIVVTWPWGATRTVRNMAANETWQLYPTELLGDVDGDGDFDTVDYEHFLDCFTGAGPGQLRPGCEVMDVDGDGDVDWDDLPLGVDAPAAGGAPRSVQVGAGG